MPLYEYTCDHCRKRFSVLVGMTAHADTEQCPHCGYAQATRRVSRFAKGRTEDDTLGSLSDPTQYGDTDDPQAMRRWATEMGKEMGEDIGDDFDEYLDASEDAPDPADPLYHHDDVQ